MLGPHSGETPLARRDGLSIEELDDELLIYDRACDVAHCLTPLAASVWRACDGKRGLASLTTHSADEVLAAVEELRQKRLLAEPSPAGMSRRQMVRRVAATAAAAPLVVSVLAPTAAHAQSQPVTCADLNDCQVPNGPGGICCPAGTAFEGTCAPNQAACG